MSDMALFLRVAVYGSTEATSRTLEDPSNCMTHDFPGEDPSTQRVPHWTVPRFASLSVTLGLKEAASTLRKRDGSRRTATLHLCS